MARTRPPENRDRILDMQIDMKRRGDRWTRAMVDALYEPNSSESYCCPRCGDAVRSAVPLGGPSEMHKWTWDGERWIHIRCEE